MGRLIIKIKTRIKSKSLTIERKKIEQKKMTDKEKDGKFIKYDIVS